MKSIDKVLLMPPEILLISRIDEVSYITVNNKSIQTYAAPIYIYV